ncbi:DVUA0089 family protein [Marinobacter sp. M1N3S26]|uniref:DVUA0089 family protein n=1 Tax=unclassified Marinobacter TaxID=83889 RepID=UPI00387B10EF
MKKSTALLAGCLMSFSGMSSAALINFTGSIDYHNDVIYTYFSLDADATDVRVWTDSFMGGANFDPITALWESDGTLINENDDNDDIDPATQTHYDSGFSLDFLSAGDYVFTVATYNNWASGNNLADGFSFDNEAPIALSDWTQPANSSDMGPNWSVWLDGVDRATNPSDPSDPAAVTESSSLALLSLGLLGLGVRRLAKAKA